jgi:isoprenylcysteine carboxyl methyltransferase (ICMT) family protein YpbQ
MSLDFSILTLFSVAIALRLISLVISGKNERKLKSENAIEYGKVNSKVLVLCHTFFYLSCLAEAIVRHRIVDTISFIGFGLFIFSMAVLWAVISALGSMWTVKLIIAPSSQKVNHSFIFKYFRHPNYFLNIIPELVAIALICQAWFTLAIGLPIYLVPLIIRIVQEEKVMKMHFKNY